MLSETSTLGGCISDQGQRKKKIFRKILVGGRETLSWVLKAGFAIYSSLVYKLII